MNKNILLRVLWVIAFFVWVVGAFWYTTKGGYFTASGDTLFHASRILEIRDAFKEGQLPSWVALKTFHHIGSAIPAMYPDFTLWPLVFLTEMLPFYAQIAAIKLALLIITLVITYTQLVNRVNSDKLVVLQLSILYALSGYALFSFVYELQPTAIIYAFGLYIFYAVYDLVNVSESNFRNTVIKLVIALVLVLFTHFLSFVVLALLILPFLMYSLFVNKNRLLILKAGTFALFLGLIISAPVLYRYFVISSTGIMQPFGQGKVYGVNIIDLITESSWAARTSVASPLGLLILTAYWGKREPSALVKVTTLLSLWMMFLSSNVVPWFIINRIPVLNNLQYAPWRFAPWLGIPLVILIARGIGSEISKIVLSSLTIISFFVATQALIGMDGKSTMVADINGPVSEEKVLKVTQKDLVGDLLQRTIVPDYLPEKIGTQSEDDSKLSNFGQRLAKEHAVYVNEVEAMKTKITVPKVNIIRYSLNSLNKGVVELPLVAYDSLKYKVTVDGKNVPSHISERSLLSFDNEFDRPTTTIKVEVFGPNYYNYVVFGEQFLMLLWIGICMVKKFDLLNFV